MIRSRILGTGHYLPPKVVTNFDVMKMMETTDEFIVERTGVRCRRHAEAGTSASDLAVPACLAAVEDAGLAMGQIDLLIMNTITPDHAAGHRRHGHPAAVRGAHLRPGYRRPLRQGWHV
jgi:3-oxoacyl-[acyl-carrier-protein] synthase-3